MSLYQDAGEKKITFMWYNLFGQLHIPHGEVTFKGLAKMHFFLLLLFLGWIISKPIWDLFLLLYATHIKLVQFYYFMIETMIESNIFIL